MPSIELPPKKPGQANEQWTDVRSVVVVGANGSGKSRFGVVIESNANPFAHRITAQRALSIPDVIQPRPYEQAESTLHYGSYQPNLSAQKRNSQKFSNRWGDEPASRLLNDYEHLLALLFADESKRDRAYARTAKDTLHTVPPPKCKLDILQEIWSKILPHRSLIVGDDKLQVRASDSSQYAARAMSDGERVAIYLIGQALCAPPNSVVIIDEPEIHLHRAILSALWDQIEVARPDCAFVYLTHDLDFAATRTQARKVWLRSFDGQNWEWDELTANMGLPEALVFQVLGSRRPILFVEGDETSLDSAIYSALFPSELVVPRYSAQKVIDATKVMNSVSALHHLSTRGVVDRDRRSDDEITALRSAGLIIADVAEIENLLCIPEAIEAVAAQLKITEAKALRIEIEAKVLEELAKLVEQQSLACALAEIQFRLNGFGPKIGNLDAESLETELQRYLNGINVSDIVRRFQARFERLIHDRDYRAALRFFNCKGIPAFVSDKFKIDRSVYCQLVIQLIRAQPSGSLARSMRDIIAG